MPRPNRPRSVLAEEHLARRIAAERDRRGMTNDGLAERMTRAGCPMTGSAIFKIEKGEPRRRIVVDELVAFARVFDVPVTELLVPPEIAARNELAELVVAWDRADNVAATAAESRDDAWEKLKQYVAEHPECSPWLDAIFEAWGERYYDEDRSGLHAALKLWDLTHDEKWAEAIRADLQRVVDQT